MTLKIKKNINETVIEVVGQIDTFTAPVLEKMINQSLSGANNVILELSGVEYISDVGLKAIYSAYEKIKDIGSLKLIGANKKIIEILKVNGFADILATN